MKFTELFKRIFSAEKKTPPGTRANPSEMMEKVFTMLSNTREEELTCEQVFTALDQFVELAARGENVDKLMPLIQHHLNMCVDCMEEYKVLERIVANVK